MPISVSTSRKTNKVVFEKTFSLQEIVAALPFSYSESKSYVKTMCENGLMVKVGKNKYKVVTTPSMYDDFVIGMN
jgi:predicted transcriptional regulator